MSAIRIQYHAHIQEWYDIPASETICDVTHLMRVRRSNFILACLVKEPIRTVGVIVREDSRIPRGRPGFSTLVVKI